MNSAISIAIFIFSYILIATEKVNKTIVAMVGGTLVVALRLVSFEDAMKAVDFNVIFLLVGMMLCVKVIARTGFFEWIAITVAKMADGDPVRITLLLLTVTAVLSAFLDNVTTIILIVPVSVLIFQLLNCAPGPLIIMEAIVSNIGGTATLIGDPPNIVIGSQVHLSFNDFLMHLGPVVVVIMLATLSAVYLLIRNRYHIPVNIQHRVTGAVPRLAIVDPVNMRKSLIILAFIFLGFILQEVTHVEPGVVALLGGMIMLLVCRAHTEETLMHVEWGVIFFFIGMFMMISALEHNGVIESIGRQIISWSGDNLLVLCLLILWGGGFLSAILDNIPFVITMVPLVRLFAHHFAESAGIPAEAARASIAEPLFWSLALGACLGGNGTLIGASANIIMSRIGEKNNIPIRFRTFLAYGVPFTVLALVISSVYIYLRYFLWAGK
ncbi:MAG: ArsB/NhaD family transporter [Candidatus Omnitrophica bacterium]|nr:ArsB/NhaD family transporter [Candidatus Omnitrophota bacterium]